MILAAVLRRSRVETRGSLAIKQGERMVARRKMTAGVGATDPASLEHLKRWSWCYPS